MESKLLHRRSSEPHADSKQGTRDSRVSRRNHWRGCVLRISPPLPDSQFRDAAMGDLAFDFSRENVYRASRGTACFSIDWLTNYEVVTLVSPRRKSDHGAN